MSKEFDAALEALKAFDDATRENAPRRGLLTASLLPRAILLSARLLALAIRDAGLAADDKWQPPTIEEALGPGG